MNRREHDGRNTIVKDPSRFDLVWKCWDLMLAGRYTVSEVREYANAVWGFRNGQGKPLGRNTLYRLFSNPFYHGSYEYPKGSGIWFTGRHTPVVTKEEFDQVQHLVSKKKEMPQNRSVFAFTGLIRCGGCGGSVIAEEKHQLICSVCKWKFAAYRSKVQCHRCKTPIQTMISPLRLDYT